MKTVFITGASSGIGEACANVFAANGYRLILNARREERLEQLASALIKTYGSSIYLLPFDVQNETVVNEKINELPEEWSRIDVLVNNAGLSLGLDFFDEANMSDWNRMIDTNVKGFLYVAQVISKKMVAQKKGHIINIGSVAAKLVYEKGNVYCATKHAVDALTKAMRIDLLRHRIKVTAIHPGAVETEFSLVRFNGDADRAKAVYKGLEALSAKDIADTVYYTTTVPEHVCIDDLVVTCLQQANAIYMSRD